MRKRLKSRPTVIDLNGHKPAAAQVYLSALAPLLLLSLCAAQKGTWGDLASLWPTALCSMLAGILYIETIRLQHNKITFTSSSIKLPGLDQKFMSFDQISNINLEERKNILCVGTKNGQMHILKLKGLSKESAKQLWQLIATKMKNAQVKPEVKDVLLNWVAAESTTDERMHTSLLNWTIAEQALAAREKVTVVRADPQLTIDLKQNSIASRMGGYVNFYIATCLQVWVVICWLLTVLIIAGVFGSHFHVPVLESISALGHVTYQNLMALILAPADLLKELLFNLLGQLTPIFGNPFGALGYGAMMVGLMVYVGRNWAEPDALEITRYGITTLKKNPSGSVPQAHINWQDLKSIELTGSFGSSSKLANSKKLGKAIKFINKEGQSLSLPLRLIGATAVRRQLLEAFDSYAASVEIDPAVLQAVAPRAGSAQEELTFTELWLDSLDSAPKLNELTPLSADEQLACGITIKSQLASGGQGMTYLAIDVQGKEVVLKETILPLYMPKAAESALAKFEQAARLLGDLDHPQIVRLFDHFVEQNRAFLVMEFVPGQTLKEKVETEGPLSQSLVIDIASQLIDILHYLHNREVPVIHRDFTPDNLIIDAQGRIKLVDFGVAIEGLEQSKSSIVGKQNYLPPEQVAGKACPQSDIYAMGATLHYLLTGIEAEPLSQSNSRETNGAISEDLSNLVKKATALELDQRLPNAEAAGKLLKLSKTSGEDLVIKIPQSETETIKVDVRRKKEKSSG